MTEDWADVLAAPENAERVWAALAQFGAPLDESMSLADIEALGEDV